VQPAHLGSLHVAAQWIGRETGGDQQCVEILRLETEHARQREHHAAPRLRAAGLEETDVTRGHTRLQRQLFLAETEGGAPEAQQPSEGAGLMEGVARVFAHSTDPCFARY